MIQDYQNNKRSLAVPILIGIIVILLLLVVGYFGYQKFESIKQQEYVRGLNDGAIAVFYTAAQDGFVQAPLGENNQTITLILAQP